MVRRRMLIGATLLAMIIGLSVWNFAAAQDTAGLPFLGIALESADHGVKVGEVVSGSPAETAGLQVGDVITAIDGKDVTADSIREIIAGHKVGDEIKLSVERGTEKMDLSATLAAQPETPAAPNITMQPLTPYPVLGVQLQDGDKGVVIRAVTPDSAAAKAGLKEGDIIQKIGDTEIKSASAAAEAVHAMSVGDAVSIQIQRNGESQTIEATLEAGAPQTQIQIAPFGNGNSPFERGFGIIYNDTDKTWQIRGLSEDSDLYKAGLREGDVIKTFDSSAYDPAGLQEYLKGLDSTKDVTLSVERDGAVQDITVTADALTNMTTFSLGTGGNFSFPFGGQPFTQAFGGARLGVQFVTLDADKAKEHNVTQTEGALVTDVMADTPAATAGLKVNDIITAVDGDTVDAEHTLRDRLFAYEAGDTIKLDVLRDGSTSEMSVTLDQGSLGDALPFFNFGQGNGFQFFGPDGVPQQPQVVQPNL